mgnify:CR=1 FL=1
MSLDKVRLDKWRMISKKMCTCCGKRPKKKGTLVFYEDHLTELAEKDAEIERLRLRLKEHGDIEIRRFLRLIVEPQKWSNSLHRPHCPRPRDAQAEGKSRRRNQLGSRASLVERRRDCSSG